MFETIRLYVEKNLWKYDDVIRRKLFWRKHIEKYIEEKNISRTDEIAVEVKAAIDELISKGGVLNA